jgi:DNA-binding NtrC family response regulator
MIISLIQKKAIDEMVRFTALAKVHMSPKTAIPPLPSDQDLRKLLHFSAKDGRIWLAGQRMLLLHTSSLAAIRRELVHTVGREHARRVLLRAGYASGQKDAVLAKQLRPNATIFDAFAIGPQLHMLEGAVQVTPEVFELDLAAGIYHGIFRWDHSWEVETHLREYGAQTEPVCWMLMGYASGYTSEFFGRSTFYKETQCEGCGASHCQIEGRFVEDWPDGAELAKDYDADSVIVRIEGLQQELQALRSKIETQDALGPLIGRSRSFMHALEHLRRAAPTKVTVLLTGETGVGKERFARSLHALSASADKAFVAVNCAALPADLIESELFGAEKGAFTGATAARAGRFERANGGTILLDEIGDLPLAAQAKLLRILQTGEVERLGSNEVRKIEVRVVAATHVDLEAAVAAGRFRRDLYYRLHVYPIHIPALRERIDDIAILATHLLERFNSRHSKMVRGFSDEAFVRMRHYAWPGNIRELENLVERSVILTASGDDISVDNLFTDTPDSERFSVNAEGQLEQLDRMPNSSGAAQIYDQLISLNCGIASLEAQLIEQAVNRAGGNLAAAARALGLTRPQLSYRLKNSQATTQ